MLWLRASLSRSGQECCGLLDTGGWQHGEVIRATCGNKEPKGQTRAAIREENKSSHYAGKETPGDCFAVMEHCSD